MVSYDYAVMAYLYSTRN